MDEGAFVPKELFAMFQALLNVDGANMLIASSPPKDPSHWFYQLRKSKSKIYRSCDFEKICPDCQKLPQDKMILCGHVKTKTSLLKNNSTRDDLATGLNINSNALIRENYGIVFQEDTCMFLEPHVERFLDVRNKMSGKLDEDKYIMAIDPAYGGSNDTAIVVVTMINGVYTIVWMDYKNTGRGLFEFIESSIHQFHLRVRQNHKIPLIIAIECIARIDGVVLDDKIIKKLSMTSTSFMNVHVIKDSIYVRKRKSEAEAMSGTTLTKRRKEQMLYNLQTLVETDQIRIGTVLNTTHVDGVKAVLFEFKDQLYRFKHFDRGVSKKLNGSVVETSSKITGKAGMNNDDVVLATMMAVYWWRNFSHHSDYEYQRSKIDELS